MLTRSMFMGFSITSYQSCNHQASIKNERTPSPIQPNSDSAGVIYQASIKNERTPSPVQPNSDSAGAIYQASIKNERTPSPVQPNSDSAGAIYQASIKNERTPSPVQPNSDSAGAIYQASIKNERTPKSKKCWRAAISGLSAAQPNPITRMGYFGKKVPTSPEIRPKRSRA